MERLRNEIWEASCQYLSTSHVSILCDPLAAEYSRQWSKVSIEDASACALHDLVDASVLRACGHVSAQHPHQHHRVLPEDLRDAQEALDTSFASRQQLLQAYIQKKRPDDADAYLTLLDTHDILK